MKVKDAKAILDKLDPNENVPALDVNIVNIEFDVDGMIDEGLSGIFIIAGCMFLSYFITLAILS
jgi:hypothetical protein